MQVRRGREHNEPMSETTTEDTQETRASDEPEPEYDPVDDWGDSSFPASDPPSWWSGPPSS
jgi:hypothetical protein